MCGWALSPLAFVLLLQAITLASFVYKNEPQLYTGDRCTLENGEGVCTEVVNCNSALLQIKQGIHPPLCHFDGHNPIVCCQQSEKLVQPGKISETKCWEYNTPDSEWVPAPIRIAVVGGIPAERGEFPHMAAVGYGEENNKRWLCGGALISPNFVLTAAHCLYTRESGDAKWARLGDLNLYNATDDSDVQQFTVVQSIPHPRWIPSQSYNDIALLKLDRNAEITLYVKIACLSVGNDVYGPLPIATGWGKTQYLGDASDNLMQVPLEFFEHEDCSKSYSVSKNLPNGLVEKTQVCAGSVSESKDTCQGDSGGPLQVKDYSDEGAKRFKLVGVTSFGKGCGIVNVPAIYTRVSAFVSWIERIVWKD